MPRAEWGEEKLPNISPRPGIIHESCLSGLLFLLRHLISSLHLAGEAVSDEVAGIENQI